MNFSFVGMAEVRREWLVRKETKLREQDIPCRRMRFLLRKATSRVCSQVLPVSIDGSGVIKRLKERAEAIL